MTTLKRLRPKRALLATLISTGLSPGELAIVWDNVTQPEIVIGDPTGVPRPLWAYSHGPTKNLKTDFLAKGDGETDDSIAIQTAVDWCLQNGYSLFVPAGTYIINTNVVAGIYLSNLTADRQGLLMYGEGFGKSVFKNGPGRVRRLGRYAKMFYCWLNDPHTRGFKFGAFTFRDLTFDGNSSSNDMPDDPYDYESSHIVAFQGMSGTSSVGPITFSNIELINKTGAGLVVGPSNVKIESIVFDNIISVDHPEAILEDWGQKGCIEAAANCQNITYKSVKCIYSQIETTSSADPLVVKRIKISDSWIDTLELTSSEGNPGYTFVDASGLTCLTKCLFRGLHVNVVNSTLRCPYEHWCYTERISNSTILLPYNSDTKAVTSFYLLPVSGKCISADFDNCTFKIDAAEVDPACTGYAMRTGACTVAADVVRITCNGCRYDPRLYGTIDAYTRGGDWTFTGGCELAGHTYAVTTGTSGSNLSSVVLDHCDFSKVAGTYLRVLHAALGYTLKIYGTYRAADWKQTYGTSLDNGACYIAKPKLVGDAAPTTGTWFPGDRVVAVFRGAGISSGWDCMVGGEPGTWIPYGMDASGLLYGTAQSVVHLPGAVCIADGTGTQYLADGSTVWASNWQGLLQLYPFERTNLLLHSKLSGNGGTPTGWTDTLSGTREPVESIYEDDDGCQAWLFTNTTSTKQYITNASTVSVAANSTYYVWTAIEDVDITGGYNRARSFLAVASLPAGATATYESCTGNPDGGSTGEVQPGIVVIRVDVGTTPGEITVKQGIGISDNIQGRVWMSRPSVELGRRGAHIPTEAATASRTDYAVVNGIATLAVAPATGTLLQGLFPVAPAAFEDAPSNGTAYGRKDGGWSALGGGVTLGSAAPLINGIPSAGSGASASHEDHTHQATTATRLVSCYEVEFYGTASAAMCPLTPAAINTGTVSLDTATITTDHPGTITFSSHASNANSGYYVSTGIEIMLGGGEKREFIFKLPTVSGEIVHAGFANTWTISSDPTYGALIQISGSTVTGRTINQSGSASTGTSYTASSDTWYYGKVEINAARTLVTYSIYTSDANHTLLWSATLDGTYLPPTNARVGAGIGAVVTSPSGATKCLVVDWDALYINRVLNR